jgi:hypothetical protein
MAEPEAPRAAVAKRSRNAVHSSTAAKPFVPDFYGAKKPKAVETIEAHEEEDIDLPNDTKVAMQAMKRDFAQLPSELVSAFPAIILKSQIYYLLEDKTKADREMNELKASGEVVEMRVPGKDPNDLYLCLTPDLVSTLQARVAALSHVSASSTTTLSPAELRTILQFFLSTIIGKHPEPFINRENLHNAFDAFLADNPATESKVTKKTEVELDPPFLSSPITLKSTKPKRLSLLTPEKPKPRIKYSEMEKALIQEGWMTRKDESSFWLCVPNFGRFLYSLKKGRSHIISSLKRAKFNEMMMSEMLQTKKIARCELNVPFVLKDLIGSSTITKTMLPAGALVRLTPAVHV